MATEAMDSDHMTPKATRYMILAVGDGKVAIPASEEFTP